MGHMRKLAVIMHEVLITVSLVGYGNLKKGLKEGKKPRSRKGVPCYVNTFLDRTFEKLKGSPNIDIDDYLEDLIFG